MRVGTVGKMVASVKLGAVSDAAERRVRRDRADAAVAGQPLKYLELSKMIRIANIGVRNNFRNETDGVAR
ncbi:hypothetical protein D3C81_1962010 [compost metagenome]